MRSFACEEDSMTEPLNILYIEDNRDNQRLVQRVLSAHGYTVMVAEDGPAGLALARQNHPILILVDINIPGLDGYETTTRLRSMMHLHDTPIVALTANVSPGARERALVVGCDGYLSKPIDARKLPQQIAEFIGGKREFVPPAVEREMLREHSQRVVERLEERVKELQVANANLQEIDRLKSQFLTTLSHELRTPLTSLLGYIDLFGRGTLGSMNDVQRDAIAVMQRNIETLSRQLNNLLYLQEYRSNQLSIAPVSLNEMADHLMRQVRPKAEHKGVALRLESEEIRSLHADPMALELALSNLLDNAIKFTPEDGTVVLSMRDEPARVVIQVEDTGRGIAAEVLDKIFLPFYRIDLSLASPEPGCGVGLALVLHIVEAHGGKVTVRSDVGVGSTFTVMLPRH
jgi:signal transduction histidine kinase